MAYVSRNRSGILMIYNLSVKYNRTVDDTLTAELLIILYVRLLHDQPLVDKGILDAWATALYVLLFGTLKRY
jgi:hypothetical protein